MIKQALSILIVSQFQPGHLHVHLNQETPDEARLHRAQSGCIANLLRPSPAPSYTHRYLNIPVYKLCTISSPCRLTSHSGGKLKYEIIHPH